MRILSMVFGALIVLTATAGCGDPATIASGEVLDGLGKPVEGVEVVMESEIAGGFRKESEQRTDETGRFNFVTVTGAATSLRLRFSKSGYKDKTVRIPALENSTHKIEIQEASPAR
ncbi:MAG: carboxypeptidase regulatory-like domain-containing protein [Acidobacteria bacterium]|nr:MAG: carboxypeptidase regulatory-like domain-containing protein [Acidobacteriota bacterium]REJ98386.1 MAG: carboxypeptidase regulatory-like domain-containing protein [Acidobacteriota bacterium]REK17130.1 MAG: carboxypeptidase regulatory-like domain-containing protein [Acidobacteriota bacterium]REK43040.1 MAG: carboxypeptidase regulatory-like domain-containing protein [Acidobacteriota bacterium]